MGFPPLSFGDASYPYSHIALICKVLDDASIPNLPWGDHILHFYGANQVVKNIGFIVPDDHLEQAANVLSSIDGLQQCDCVKIRHNAKPTSEYSIKTHFPVQDGLAVIYLAPSSSIMGLVPLTNDQPNPLELSFQTLFLPVVSQDAPLATRTPLLNTPNIDEPTQEVEYYQTRILDLRSIVIIHLHLWKASQDKRTERNGLGLPWQQVLWLLIFDVDPKTGVLGTIEGAESQKLLNQFTLPLQQVRGATTAPAT